MTEALPARGQIWWVQFDPAIGSEANKLRPAIVASVDEFAGLPIRLVIPLTTWRQRFANHPNKVFVPQDDDNNLGEDSGADFLLVRSVHIERFGEQLGRVRDDVLRQCVRGVALLLGYEAG